ncbi:MAG: alpha-N-arabinofuranosidase [Oscillospiraceae bacterium]|nr:alpha-N-arabinofuranosidase [Oscillospiraceae bacterium]
MRYVVNPTMPRAFIHPEVYGNFSEHLGRCIYEGVYVGENSTIPNVNGMRTDVVEALKKMKLPVLRWPGGCFADEYHWRDGIGPKESRKKMINTHWGGVVEDNSFGTHEFFELCRQIGCKPYVNGNVGSGSVQEMQEWIEYMNSPAVSPMANLRRENGQDEPFGLEYFAVGNENWGCGGNMTAEYYANEYRRYQTYVRNYTNKRVYKIACGPGTNVGRTNYQWTRTLMEQAGNMMNGLSLHYYTVPNVNRAHRGSATEFDLDEYYRTLGKAHYIEKIIHDNASVMDLYDPDCRVGLIVDEWGTWYDVEPGTNPGFLYQQSTMRDAIVAAISLNIFNKFARRVHMANIAQLVNVLQAVILTEGAKMLCTPTYHVFEMYKAHQGAQLVESAIETPYFAREDILPGMQTRDGIRPLSYNTPCVTESASVAEDGTITVTIANLSAADAAPIEMRLDAVQAKLCEARILTGDIHDKNEFDDADHVRPVDFDGVTLTPDAAGTEVRYTLPPCSVVVLRFE